MTDQVTLKEDKIRRSHVKEKEKDLNDKKNDHGAFRGNKGNVEDFGI